MGWSRRGRTNDGADQQAGQANPDQVQGSSKLIK